VTGSLDSASGGEKDIVHESLEDSTAHINYMKETEARLKDLLVEEKRLKLQYEFEYKTKEVQKLKAGIAKLRQSSPAPLPSVSDKRTVYDSVLSGPNVGYQYDESSDSPGIGDYPGLASLGISRSTYPQTISAAHGEAARLDLHPQSYLYTPNDPGTSTKKYRSIVEYIPKGARQSAESAEEHEMAPGIVLSLSGGKRIKLDSVTPAQWVSANACILADILKRDNPGPHTAIDYMSDTTKIGELATQFTWKSVIQFDDQYREKQHEFKFRWGSDTPHISTVKLIPRHPANLGPSITYDKGKKSAGGDSQNRSGMPVCRYWNRNETCI
jgi:hypothetical protein